LILIINLSLFICLLGFAFGLFVFNYSLGISLEYGVIYPHLFSGLVACFFTITYVITNSIRYRSLKSKRTGKQLALGSAVLMLVSVVAGLLTMVWWNFFRN